jgi:hypothetical protein
MRTGSKNILVNVVANGGPGSGPKPGGGSGAISDSAGSPDDYAAKKRDFAMKMTKTAMKTNTRDSHYAAAAAHDDAEESNLASGNTRQAAYHHASADMHREMGGRLAKAP